MGIKHLRSIEHLLRTNNKFFSKTEIKDTLVIDYYSVIEILEYFVDDKKVVVKDFDGIKKYSWKRVKK